MSDTYQIKPIAVIKNDFTSKFGIPRQSGILDKMESRIIFEPEYRVGEALRGIEQYSHLWLIWLFSESADEKFRPTVRPPRLGGNKRVGVFATRSPFRPNSLGLSSVRLKEVRDTPDHGKILIVTGADLMDGTPIFDIKPYVKYSDSHPEAECGFSDEFKDYALQVIIPEDIKKSLPEEKLETITGILRNDPRPSYQHDPEREYSFEHGGISLSFKVDGEVLTVTKAESERKEGHK